MKLFEILFKQPELLVPAARFRVHKVKKIMAQSIKYTLLNMVNIFNCCCNIYAPHHYEVKPRNGYLYPKNSI
jgi:hypothetical protein